MVEACCPLLYAVLQDSIYWAVLLNMLMTAARSGNAREKAIEGGKEEQMRKTGMSHNLALYPHHRSHIFSLLPRGAARAIHSRGLSIEKG